MFWGRPVPGHWCEGDCPVSPSLIQLGIPHFPPASPQGRVGGVEGCGGGYGLPAVPLCLPGLAQLTS